MLKIFDAEDLNESVPSDFNAVKIELDGGLKSALDWSEAKEFAQKQVDSGLNIFWELDLGLGKGLSYPLSHTSQFLTLKLAIEHFCSEIWSDFHTHTLGIALYRGDIDFSVKFHWDEEQSYLFESWRKDNVYAQEIKENILTRLYCRDAIGEYIELLAGHLPEQLRVYLLLKNSNVIDVSELGYLLKRDRFPHLQIALKGKDLPSPGMSWEEGRSSFGFIGRDLAKWDIIAMPDCGVCIPTTYTAISAQRLQEIFQVLDHHQVSYRIVSEELLNMEWDGLNYLVVSSDSLSSQGLRQLKGFCAAGGTILTFGNALNLPQEVPFHLWLHDSLISQSFILFRSI